MTDISRFLSLVVPRLGDTILFVTQNLHVLRRDISIECAFLFRVLPILSY